MLELNLSNVLRTVTYVATELNKIVSSVRAGNIRGGYIDKIKFITGNLSYPCWQKYRLQIKF